VGRVGPGKARIRKLRCWKLRPMPFKFTGSILAPRGKMEAPTTLGRIVVAAQDFRLFSLSGDRLVEARAMAEKLISPDIASLETMQWVQEKTQLGLLGVTQADLDENLEHGTDQDPKSPLAGLLGFVPLTDLGAQAVLRDEFNAVEPAFEHICDFEEEPAAIFGWGIAVTQHEAARLIVHVGGLIREHLIPSLDWYARVVTNDGARLLMERMGWKTLEGSKLGTLWYPSLHKIQNLAHADEVAT
jgi:hypothetical protein